MSAPAGRDGLTRRDLLARAGLAASGVALSGCALPPIAGGAARSTGAQEELRPSALPQQGPQLPRVATYQPEAEEGFPQLKLAATDFVQVLVAFPTGDQESALARARSSSGGLADARRLRAAAAPLLVAGTSSVGEILFAQVGGLSPVGPTADYGVVMVGLRQHLLTASGLRSVTRVLDVRLQLQERSWAVAELVSAGGDAVPRGTALPPAAARVLDDARIELPDTARWDIHAGRVATPLLQVMASAANIEPYGVSVLQTGHPYRIVDGRTPAPVSSHSVGKAVDLWRIGGSPVVQQRRERSSPAVRLLRTGLLPSSATSLGLPEGWDLDGAQGRLFDNAVHDDHVHISVGRAA